MLQEARFDKADLSRARLSGANLVSASFEDASLLKTEMEFALMPNAMLQGACLCEADMSGALLDGAVLTRADLRKANFQRRVGRTIGSATAFPFMGLVIRWRLHRGCRIAPLSNWHREVMSGYEGAKLTTGGSNAWVR